MEKNFAQVVVLDEAFVQFWTRGPSENFARFLERLLRAVAYGTVDFVLCDDYVEFFPEHPHLRVPLTLLQPTTREFFSSLIREKYFDVNALLPVGGTRVHRGFRNLPALVENFPRTRVVLKILARGIRRATHRNFREPFVAAASIALARLWADTRDALWAQLALQVLREPVMPFDITQVKVSGGLEAPEAPAETLAPEEQARIDEMREEARRRRREQQAPELLSCTNGYHADVMCSIRARLWPGGGAPWIDALATFTLAARLDPAAPMALYAFFVAYLTDAITSFDVEPDILRAARALFFRQGTEAVNADQDPAASWEDAALVRVQQADREHFSQYPIDLDKMFGDDVFVKGPPGVAQFCGGIEGTGGVVAIPRAARFRGLTCAVFHHINTAGRKLHLLPPLIAWSLLYGDDDTRTLSDALAAMFVRPPGWTRSSRGDTRQMWHRFLLVLGRIPDGPDMRYERIWQLIGYFLFDPPPSRGHVAEARHWPDGIKVGATVGGLVRLAQCDELWELVLTNTPDRLLSIRRKRSVDTFTTVSHGNRHIARPMARTDSLQFYGAPTDVIVGPHVPPAFYVTLWWACQAFQRLEQTNLAPAVHAPAGMFDVGVNIKREARIPLWVERGATVYLDDLALALPRPRYHRLYTRRIAYPPYNVDCFCEIVNRLFDPRAFPLHTHLRGTVGDTSDLIDMTTYGHGKHE